MNNNIDTMEKRMAKLVCADGISGFEDNVRKYLKEMLTPVSEVILCDRLGSLVGKKTGLEDGPRVLIAGHLDEVGFILTDITSNGFLRFQTVGGWWSQNVLAHKVRISTRSGKIFEGIIGSKPPHLLKPEEAKKVVKLDEMFIDIGAIDDKEVAEWGIRVGDPITPASDFYTFANGRVWGGKALDNRAGCAMAVEILERLQNEKHPNIVYAGASVQEEVGLRGAQTLAYRVRPDVAFAIDVGCASDTPGFDNSSASLKMGQGPTLVIKDASLIPHKGLRDFVIDTAEELEIPLQFDAMERGGTDGGKFHLTGIGCPTVVIGFATRYIHSHNALMSRNDFEQAANLLTALVQRIDQKILSSWINF